MSKPVKWGLILLGVFFAALLALPFVLPALIPNAWLREEIMKQLSAVVKRPISVGDVRLSTWMGVSVVVKDLSIGNREGFSKDPFLVMKEFRLQVKLLPLLSKQVAVEELSFTGPSAVLERGADGRANWEELVALPPERGPDGVHGLATILAAEPSLTFSADTIRCRQGELVYRDLAVGETTRLAGLDLDFAVSRFAVPAEEGILPLLAGIDGRGQLRLAALEHPAAAFDKVVLDLRAAAGKLALEGTGAGRLGGALSFAVDADVTPSFRQGARLSFDGFAFGGAFSDRYLRAFSLGLAQGAVARLDGTVEIAAQGLFDAQALWASATGKGGLGVSGVNLGQIAMFEKGFASIQGSLGFLSGHLKPETFAKLQTRMSELGQQVKIGVDYAMSAPKIDNILSIATVSQGVLSVPGEVDKQTFAIRYTVSEDSFGDPEVKELWREYVGEPHVITGTATAPDWNEGKLMSNIQKRAISNMLKQKKEKQKNQLEDKLKDELEDLNPFKKKKKR